MTVKILATGDFHLGRTPSRLHNDLSALDFSVEDILERITNYATQNGVNYVVLTGDLVDSSNKMFEGYSALERFVGELISSGIEVIAVAGNHDYDVLPRIKRQIPDLKLLANGNEWGEVTFQKNGEMPIRFQGRSFSASSQQLSPLQNYSYQPTGVFTVGVLHCDPDTEGSVYGSVSIKTLDTAGPEVWLLGHIHKPQVYQGLATVVVCGCPQGLDPGESGSRGPWLIEVDSNRKVSVRHIPLGVLNYERLELDLSSTAAVSDIREQLLTIIRKWDAEKASILGEVKAVAVRLILCGATRLFSQLPKVIQEIENDSLVRIGDRSYFIEKIINAATSAVDLESLARQQDLVGLYTQKLIAFSENCSGREAIEAKRKLRAKLAGMTTSVENFLPGGASLSESQLEVMLKQAGEVVLARLLEQKSGGERP